MDRIDASLQNDVSAASDAFPRVDIILVTWNHWEDTIECLESLFRSDYPCIRVLVCDNGSQDETVDKIRDWANGGMAWQPPSNDVWGTYVDFRRSPNPVCHAEIQMMESSAEIPLLIPEANLLVVKLGQNLGFGKANNVGLHIFMQDRYSRYAWLLNNDTVITKESCSLMVDSARCGNTIIGSWLMNYFDPQKVQAVGGGRLSKLTGSVTVERQNGSAQLDFINGASFMLDKTIINTIGFFDESLFMYFEENDYCMRAEMQNIKMRVSQAKVYHKGGVSSGGTGSFFSWYHVYLNKYRVLRKNLGIGFWLLFMLASLVIQTIIPQANTDKRNAASVVLRRIVSQRFNLQ